ncbi:uncharacterized protein LOC134771921 [Penaeus indicus]|uniref:uncharacterized protein LOC134771921 n=1 Tax=Penaeus indicus TaxID=29960 RepID=UPI00300C21E4
MFPTLQTHNMYNDPHHPHRPGARAPFASIAEDEMKDQLQIGRAPIASLDCMEEFQGCGGDHVSTRSDSQALVSRQSSIASCLKYKPLGKSGLRVSQLGLVLAKSVVIVIMGHCQLSCNTALVVLGNLTQQYPQGTTQNSPSCHPEGLPPQHSSPPTSSTDSGYS